MIDAVPWWRDYAHRQAGWDAPSLRAMSDAALRYLSEMGRIRATMSRAQIAESGWDEVFSWDVAEARRVADAMLARLAILKTKPRTLACTCCGAPYLGRQWWNQDAGHGLGYCCAEFATRGMDPDEAIRTYGAPGWHRCEAA